MDRPLKTWNYEQYGTAYQLECYQDRIKIITSDSSYESSFNKVFEYASIYNNAEVTYELFKLITKQEIPQDLSLKFKRQWEFWQALDASKIVEKIWDLAGGAKWFIANLGIGSRVDIPNEEPYISDQHRLDRFFFYGPNTTGAILSLAIRKELQQLLWNALNHSLITFSLEDAFLLFDYEKIEPKFYMGSQEFLEIKKGFLRIGEAIDPRYGNQYGVSIERAWYNLDNVIPAEFKAHLPEIKQILSKAILNSKANQAPSLD
ncbi:MAG: hypothetical protein GY810_15685 [Aureispira sp.]|nr:hypothetical protein [Aureispira sp.]